ncbi:MAG: putative C-S lyase [Opitutae bacterium]|nr:putative C-S lyase [Opitutae bacterium]
MPFDFDTVIDRAASDSRKWRKYAGRDVLPLWIADMDFAAPPAVTAALRARVDCGIFGYGDLTEKLVESFRDYCRRRYRWEVKPEWLFWLPGLVCGLNVTARAYGTPGEEIISCTPIYQHFREAAVNQGQTHKPVPFVRHGARWEIDFDALERTVTSRTRQLTFCSPHNPLGRAFSRAELERVAALCLRHNLILTSDDIHCDLVLDDTPHVPFATLAPEIAARTVTLMAPSKTYNIPGLGCSVAIIPDPELRKRYDRAAAGIVPDVNLLGLVAGEAAWRHGEPWRQALLAYLRGNRDLLQDFVAHELPGVSMTPVEATYLAWLDVSALQLEAPQKFFEQHGVGLLEGAIYGAPRGHFVRLNFGCRRATLAEALARMKRAVAAR